MRFDGGRGESLVQDGAMKQRPFGKASVSVLGQGTWRMEADDRDGCIAALRRGLDLGMTHIDTAELYGRGRVEEEIVSKAIAGRREEVFLVSKVLPSHADQEGTVRACEQSLKRLGTDHLDCYLLHWPGDVPLEQTIAGFEALVKAGKIRAWGVSNFDVSELDEALAVAGPGRIACNQVLYHLEQRAMEHRVLPWCEQHGVAVVAYSPFGAGAFPRAGASGRKVLDDIAQAHGASAHQVALAFLTRRPSVLAIPKHSSVAHAEDNARAADLALTTEELKRIEAAFPLRSGRALPTL